MAESNKSKYHLYTTYQLGAHTSDPSRIQRGPIARAYRKTLRKSLAQGSKQRSSVMSAPAARVTASSSFSKSSTGAKLPASMRAKGNGSQALGCSSVHVGVSGGAWAGLLWGRRHITMR